MTRAPWPSTISADGMSQAPRTTIASLPVSLPAIAKWLDASASFRRSVSGDFATTANFALVVSGVPTSGENTNANGASGASGSTPGGASSDSKWVPSPTPPSVERRIASCSGKSLLVPSLTSTTSALPKYPPVGIRTTLRRGGHSAPGVRRRERDLVALGQRLERIARDLVAVERREHVLIQRHADGGRGRPERCRTHLGRRPAQRPEAAHLYGRLRFG